jgi:hypothetical protein
VSQTTSRETQQPSALPEWFTKKFFFLVTSRQHPTRHPQNATSPINKKAANDIKQQTQSKNKLRSLFTMKTIQYSLAAVVTAFSLCVSDAKAVEVVFEVIPRGRTDWVLVVKGSGTGGRIVWSAARNRFISDRAERGESFRAALKATTAAERVSPTASITSNFIPIPGPFTAPIGPVLVQSRVTTDANKDNLFVTAKSVSQTIKYDIPIGRRPY